jgi:hypothetical protein
MADKQYKTIVDHIGRTVIGNVVKEDAKTLTLNNITDYCTTDVIHDCFILFICHDIYFMLFIIIIHYCF